MEKIIVKKKNEVFLHVVTEPGIEMELTEHFCFFVPGPPNLGLSKQFVQRAQSAGIKHGLHTPHSFLLFRNSTPFSLFLSPLIINT